MYTEEDISRIPYRRGSYSSTIAFVGEAPGEMEERDEFKRPFIGASGQLLEQMMANSGIDPSSVYFTNVIKERPDDKEIHRWIKKNKDRFDLFTTILNTELSSLPNLQMIVPVGAVALQAICGKPSIDNWRGSIIPATLSKVKGKKCIPIIHPAAILRLWLYKPATVLDMQRIAKQRLFPEIRSTKRNPKIRPSFEDIITYIYFLKSSDCLISVDLETLPRPQRIVSIQLSHSSTEGIAILFQHRDGSSIYSEDQELVILKALMDLLHNCGKRIIGQNILTFDLFLLEVYGFNIQKLLENVYLDTMEAAKCLQPQLPVGLDFLTSVYTEEPYYKSEGKEWGTKQGEDEFLHYGVKDVMVVSEIAPQLHAELKEDNLLEFYYERFQKLARARLKMSRRGLLISEEKRAQLETTFSREIVVEQCKLNILVGENLNVKSTPQMKKLLYEKMKLPLQWSARGTVTCDEDALLTLSAKYPSEMFRHILNVRGKRTLFSSNIKARRDSDGRIRCSYGFAETGRFRSYECPLGSGCLLPEAEVLTPRGWIRFDLLQETDKVMQWDKTTSELSFVIPQKIHIYDHDGLMIIADSWFHKNVYTYEHKIPCKLRRTLEWGTRSALNISNLDEQLIPLGGFYSGNTFSTATSWPQIVQTIDCNLLRVAVMVQADGSIEGNNIRLSFKKQRKIDRCRMLLKTAGIEYTMQSDRIGYERFCISTESAKPIIELLGPNKQFDNWLLQFNNILLCEFIDELKFWDAHVRGDSFIYYSTNEQNARWVHTISHLCGNSATISSTINNTHIDSFGKAENSKLLWSVAIKPKNEALSYTKHFSMLQYKGKVYCVTTDTGFFLTKYKDVISVTGNSNLQNWAPQMRVMVVPDPGMVFVEADLSQAEARVVAWKGRIKYMMEIFRKNPKTPEGDIHRHMAALIFRMALAEITKKGPERYAAKRIVHACLTPDHEVLTPIGWRSIADIKEGDLVAQWSQFQGRQYHSNFAPVQATHQYDYTGDLYFLRGQSISACMTPNHRVPVCTLPMNPIYAVQADSVYKKFATPKVPFTSILQTTNTNLNLTTTELALIIAIQADGSCDRIGNRVIFHLTKPEKKQRILELLTRANVEYETDSCKCHIDGIRVWFSRQSLPNVFAYIDVMNDKELSYDLLQVTQQQRLFMLDEIVFWDGSRGTGKSNARYYFTTSEKNAIFVQTLAHLSNQGTVFNFTDDVRILESGNTRKRLYKLSINNRQLSNLSTNVKYETQNYNGKVYCLTVPSSYFLIRHNNIISITGNSNYGMSPPTFAKRYNKDAADNNMPLISIQESAKFLASFHESVPELRAGYHAGIETQLKMDKTLWNPFGRRMVFHDRIGPDLFRAGYAWYAQSTVADVTNIILDSICEELDVLLQVHDSVLVQCAPNEVNQVIKIMKLANPTFTVGGEPLKIPMEFKQSSISWGDLKDYDDEEITA
jgi:uracil-DNA glycosylase family 4